MGEVLEYITCKKCGIQQKKENFWYCASKHEVCKFCNKKTNIIPHNYKTSTTEVIEYLSKIIFDPRNETSIILQTQMNPVFTFLQRKHCREMELKEQNK